MSQAQTDEQFGKYKLLQKIGEGGMATVYLAQADDAPPGSAPVVIKRLHERLEKDRDAVDLFLTEADVTMMLDHPNIIRVYDSGEVGDRYYMCMEYVHGKDLEQISDRLRQKRIVMPVEPAVQIALEILRGLDYIHNAKSRSGRALGIVHRDVTPSNVYVSTTGGIKLGDFGVAKLVGVEGWTMAGSLKGKLGYLSPEQILGQSPAQSIDLWAAAVIFYEMLAGVRAFTGEAELEIMLKIRAAKVPRLRKVNNAAPKALEKILSKAMHKKQKKRYASAAEMGRELEAFQQKNGGPLDAQAMAQRLTQLLT